MNTENGVVANFIKKPLWPFLWFLTTFSDYETVNDYCNILIPGGK